MPYTYAVVWWERSHTGWAHRKGEKKSPWPRLCNVQCFTSLARARKFQKEWSKKDRPGLYLLLKDYK